AGELKYEPGHRDVVEEVAHQRQAQTDPELPERGRAEDGPGAGALGLLEFGRGWGSGDCLHSSYSTKTLTLTSSRCCSMSTVRSCSASISSSRFSGLMVEMSMSTPCSRSARFTFSCACGGTTLASRTPARRSTRGTRMLTFTGPCLPSSASTMTRM